MALNQPSRQQERTDRSTKALLDAAADLIVEGGLAALTFAAIGERSGYSRGLVTARFGSKDALVEALLDRIFTTWSHRNVLPRTLKQPGLEAVCTLVDAIEVQAARNSKGIRTMYALMFEAVGGEPELRRRMADLNHEARHDVTKLIRRGQRDGSIDPTRDAADEAALFLAGLRGTAYQWVLDPERFPVVPALQQLRRSTVERLSPRV